MKVDIPSQTQVRKIVDKKLEEVYRRMSAVENKVFRLQRRSDEIKFVGEKK